jgi:hypothetical protein
MARRAVRLRLIDDAGSYDVMKMLLRRQAQLGQHLADAGAARGRDLLRPAQGRPIDGHRLNERAKVDVPFASPTGRRSLDWKRGCGQELLDPTRDRWAIGIVQGQLVARLGRQHPMSVGEQFGRLNGHAVRHMGGKELHQVRRLDGTRQLDDVPFISRRDADGSREREADARARIESARKAHRNPGSRQTPFKESQGVAMRDEPQVAVDRVPNRRAITQCVRDPSILFLGSGPDRRVRRAAVAIHSFCLPLSKRRSDSRTVRSLPAVGLQVSPHLAGLVSQVV